MKKITCHPHPHKRTIPLLAQSLAPSHPTQQQPQSRLSTSKAKKRGSVELHKDHTPLFAYCVSVSPLYRVISSKWVR
ncbi:hypothetical protein E6O75_ATG02427 [Venturia nashicola]|uniref:Uncharacterized protein n=1 Tax=Venturia nashicola TaxID=86259 RepID=A0A4Z1PN40_9PEZI|nr:hypothetical protein E6O75_ATG02427 [Venturia nashicola]